MGWDGLDVEDRRGTTMTVLSVEDRRVGLGGMEEAL